MPKLSINHARSQVAALKERYAESETDLDTAKERHKEIKRRLAEWEKELEALEDRNG